METDNGTLQKEGMLCYCDALFEHLAVLIYGDTQTKGRFERCSGFKKDYCLMIKTQA